MKHAKSTREAISQTRPFRSVRHEAVIALFLAAESVRRRFDRIFSAGGRAPHEHEAHPGEEPCASPDAGPRVSLTGQQYNVLRILRGAGPEGLPVLEIAARMIEETPGITRLLDRLETAQLVTRTRETSDRRVVRCRIAPAGLRVLASFDGPLAALDEDVLACLSPRETRVLVRLLDRVRYHQTRSRDADGPVALGVRSDHRPGEPAVASDRPI